MTMREALQHVLQVLQQDPVLAFVQDRDILIGDRKHGDDLVRYQINLWPAAEDEPRGTRTFGSAAPRVSTGRDRPVTTGQKLVRYRLFLDLWCRETDSFIRLMGAPGSPGILDMVMLVKDALERAWRYKPSIQALEFGDVSYIETYPPPKAKLEILIEEQVSVDTRGADIWRQLAGQDAKERRDEGA